MEKTKVVIEFENVDAAKWFVNYMNCWGEQAYWSWMDGGCNRPDHAVARYFTYSAKDGAYIINAK